VLVARETRVTTKLIKEAGGGGWRSCAWERCKGGEGKGTTLVERGRGGACERRRRREGVGALGLEMEQGSVCTGY